MATYEYRCHRCGTFEVVRPIGTAPAAPRCPTCGAAAARVYSAPAVTRVPRALAAARRAEEASRDAPAVVTGVPPRSGRRRAGAADNPRLARLPRP